MSDQNNDDAEASKIAALMAKLDMNSVMEKKEIFDVVFQTLPVTIGKATSKKEREELKLKDPNLVYGEVTYDALGLVFEKIKKVYGKPFQGTSGPLGFLQHRGGIFYDLGSGTGKGVVAAAILHNFDICYGIEYLEGLYSLSLDALNSYNTRAKPRLVGRESDTHCQFVHGDFLKTRTKDWRDGDIVFINSTCYDDELMAKIAGVASGMKKGSFCITLTKRLPSTDFTVLEYELCKMSWGEATIFIMQKMSDPKSVGGEEDGENEDDDDEEEEEDGEGEEEEPEDS